MKTVATNKEKFIWNMLGSLSNAISSLVLSICVNRILGSNSGGIFAFAYANAQLMLTIGGFEVRPYQSTDVDEKYSFNSYFTLRILTCILMMVVSSVYIIFNGFSIEKGAIVFILALFKMVEALTDVFAGRFQQKDRIDISGRLFFIRVVSSTIVFILLAAITNSLIIASVGLFVTSFTLFWVYDCRYIFKEDKSNIKLQKTGLFSLIKEVLPLFIGAFIMMYISNAPKYAINSIYGDEMQNIYNILFMPAFVINLFSIFIFRPMLVQMTVNWNERNLKKLWTSIFKMYGIIAAFTMVALAGVWLLGIPVLSVLYNIDLSGYRIQLMMVMLSGGISALMTFSYYVVTIMRQQKLLLCGYVTAFIYAYIMSEMLVKKMGIDGAILTYGSTVGLLVIVFAVIIIYTNFTKGKIRENEKINLHS